MTKYEEIREAFRTHLPQRVALSKAIEELPLRLRNAVEAELAPPSDRTEFFSALHGRDIPFVYLARLVREEPGRKYAPCSAEDALFRDCDGVLHFGLGLAIEGPGIAAYTIHWLIALEDITPERIVLKIAGAPGTIDVKTGEPGSYAAAAKEICAWMLAFQSDNQAALGDKATIGFRAPR